jgi:CheY-like chemotaxis protein
MASDGDEGIRKAVEELPNFVILDIMMPGKDGGDVAAALRKDKKTKDIPILFLSSLVQSEETRPCRMKDRISFLSKPYNKDSLLNALKRCASYRE